MRTLVGTVGQSVLATDDGEHWGRLGPNVGFHSDAMVRTLVDTFRREQPPLVISTYDGVVAPPILYGRALFEELRALDAEACGKSVVRRHRAEAAELRWPKEALSDLDAPEDLERVRARLEAA